jgi:hypothetical protein
MSFLRSLEVHLPCQRELEQTLNSKQLAAGKTWIKPWACFYRAMCARLKLLFGDIRRDSISGN